MAERAMTPGQKAYEAKRAAKSGKSLDKHLDEKRRRAEAEVKAAVVVPPKKPGLFARLLDRAHKPLKPDAPGKK